MDPRAHFTRTHMHLNIHPLERWVRGIIGLIMVVMAFSGQGINAWYLLGAYPLLTGIMGWCPVYYSMGFNTNRWARVKVDRTLK